MRGCSGCRQIGTGNEQVKKMSDDKNMYGFLLVISRVFLFYRQLFPLSQKQFSDD